LLLCGFLKQITIDIVSHIFFGQAFHKYSPSSQKTDKQSAFNKMPKPATAEQTTRCGAQLLLLHSL